MIGRNEASQVRVTWNGVERGAMSTTLQDLSSEIRHFSAEVRRLEPCPPKSGISLLK